MDCKDVLFGRSVRKYTSEPVSDEDLQYIIDARLYGPSAVDLQPWYFLVIKSKEAMEKLTGYTGVASDILEPGLKERFANHPQVVDDTVRFIRQLGGAPVCILVFQLKKTYPKGPLALYQSIGAAVENMLLAAYDRGLGSCYLTAPVETSQKEYIEETFAPDKGGLLALVTIGHPEVTPKAPRRKNGRYEII